MKTKNYLLGALLIPGMMLAASGGALAAERGEEQRSDRAQDGPAQAEERRNERAEDGPARAEERHGGAMDGETYLGSKPQNAFYADELIGTDVKSTADDAEIGTVTHLIIHEEGEVVGLIVGVGGLLGLGDKHVAIAWDALELTKDDDGDYVVRVNETKEALENALDYVKD